MRLYASDNGAAAGDMDNATPQKIANFIGIGKQYDFRVIAVCFAPVSATFVESGVTIGTDYTALEFSGGGETYTLTRNAIKPARVRVPKQNMLVGQWFHRNADGTISGSIKDVGQLWDVTIVPGTGNSASAAVQYIDVAIRY